MSVYWHSAYKYGSFRVVVHLGLSFSGLLMFGPVNLKLLEYSLDRRKSSDRTPTVLAVLC